MSVFLSNLDDYINPSQACINPFVLSKTNTNINEEKDKNSNDNNNKKKKIVIETDNSDVGIGLTFSNDIKPNIIKTTNTSKSNNNIKVASISLNDCLACSGCVTSAEAILIQEQSNDKLIRLLEERDENTSVVVMISPNSRASIADFLGMDPTDFFLRLSSILKLLGVTYVLDAAAGNDVALIESREEFLYR